MKLSLPATICVFFLTTVPSMAQSASEDFFRSTGKIYTVLTVMVILFVVFIIFLVRLDRKISKLENKLNNE